MAGNISNIERLKSSILNILSNNGDNIYKEHKITVLKISDNNNAELIDLETSLSRFLKLVLCFKTER